VDRSWPIIVKVAGAIALLGLVGVCVSDFYTDFWVEHAMFTAVLSAVLVATVAGSIVDRYLERRDLQRWRTVAAIATGEFAFSSRWVRRVLLDCAGLPAPDEAEETLSTLATPEGAAKASLAIDALAHDPDARARLYPRLREMLDASGQVLGRWSPLMVRGDHVDRLNDFVALTGRVFKLADELSKEQLEHRAIPLGEDWIAGRIAKLIDLAAQLELEFTTASRKLSPLEEWIGAPEWFQPARERETAAAG
jgi:hypothetical protein